MSVSSWSVLPAASGSRSAWPTPWLKLGRSGHSFLFDQLLAWHSRGTRVGASECHNRDRALGRVAPSTLPATTTMSDPPPPPSTQRKSRVLAALDNPSFLSPNPTTTPLAPTLQVPVTPVSLGFQTPIKQRYSTPAPLNPATILGLVGVGSALKRKASGPENEYDYGQGSGSSPIRATPRGSSGLRPDFALNYDQETPVLSIDRGGDDQALKYVVFGRQSTRIELN